MASKSLRVFVAGSEDGLGKNVVDKLVRKGHEVVGVFPSATSPSTSLTKLLDSKASYPQVIVNTYHPLPLESFSFGKKLSKASSKESESDNLKEIRRQQLDILLKAARQIGEQHNQRVGFVQESTLWAVRAQDGSFFEEDTKHKDWKYGDFIAAEEDVADLPEYSANISSIILRCGLIYSDHSELFQKLARGLLKNKVPIVGSGSNIVPVVHEDDAATAFLLAVEKSLSAGEKTSIGHVLDDGGSTMASLLTEMAHRLEASEPSSVPAWMAKLVVSSEAIEFLTSSTNTSNKNLKKNFGWSPEFTTFTNGIAEVVSKWKESGLLAEWHKDRIQ